MKNREVEQGRAPGLVVLFRVMCICEGRMSAEEFLERLGLAASATKHPADTPGLAGSATTSDDYETIGEGGEAGEAW